MFDGKYIDWNAKRIKGIIDFYGHKWFYYKRVLDLGCGHADISAALHRLGADITAIDARPEHLKIANKKYPGIKTLKADLDQNWPFPGKQFDMILDLDILCHLRDYESHLRSVCASTTHLILETAVLDSEDPFKSEVLQENKAIYDLSINGVSSRPSAAAIERILTECGMNWKRIDSGQYNAGTYTYDWNAKNDGSTNINHRRLWYAVKNNSPIQFAKPPPPEHISLNAFQNANYRTTGQITASQTPPSFFAQPPRPPIPPLPPTPSQNMIPDGGQTWYAPSMPLEGKRKFVIVIPSYNNEKWCVKNINSAINQNYDQFRVIFTDDCSKDNTFGLVNEVVQSANKAHLTTLIKNEQRMGALANLYNMIHACADDEIVLTLDGDDWFPHENVLNRLNEIYSDGNTWITYGQYTNYPMGGIGVASPYPPNIVETTGFRGFTWGASHLRTFYAWLFKKIKKDDLMRGGIFFPMTWDFAMMFPMLEMAGKHSKYLSDILYVYNLENPINDHKVNQALQQDLDRYIRGLPKYPLVQSPLLQPGQPNVGLLIIATGKYHTFIQGLISSADRYFFNGIANVSYYIFTETPRDIQSFRPIVYVPTEHRPFPYASMNRYQYFTQNADKFGKENYLFYIDVDCLFVDHVSTEILQDLVGVRHCGFLGGGAPFETNPASTSYVEPSKQRFYYGGGFQGGKRERYLEAAKWCYEALEKDIANGIIPVWHDESILNKYFSENPPSINLSPAYHFPQNDIERYRAKWSPYNFQAKILLLSKDHQAVRS
jgi:glycosyltransferase involved in cell wall biosynthesis/SAM-dependent methyltransferase